MQKIEQLWLKTLDPDFKHNEQFYLYLEQYSFENIRKTTSEIRFSCPLISADLDFCCFLNRNGTAVIKHQASYNLDSFLELLSFYSKGMQLPGNTLRDIVEASHHFVCFLLFKLYSNLQTIIKNTVNFSGIQATEVGNSYFGISFVAIGTTLTTEYEARFSFKESQCAFFFKGKVDSLSATSFFDRYFSETLDFPLTIEPENETMFRILFRRILLNQYKKTNDYKVRSTFNPSLIL